MTPERQNGKGSGPEGGMAVFGYIPSGCSQEDYVSVDVVDLGTRTTTLVSGVYTRRQLFSPDFSETVRADIAKKTLVREITQTIQEIINIKEGQNEEQK